MPDISRRALLTAATIALVSGSGTAVAATRKPRAGSPGAVPQDTTGRQGNASVTVDVTSARDVAEVHYTITNVGSVPDTFTIYYADQNSGRQSRKRSYPLEPGDSVNGEMYGPVTHSFVVNVCQSDATCFAVGPVGPSRSLGSGPARGLQARPQK